MALIGADHRQLWNVLLTKLMVTFREDLVGPFDDLVLRAAQALAADNYVELDHVCSLMLTNGMMRGFDTAELSREWGDLSREYHKKYCPDCKRSRA